MGPVRSVVAAALVLVWLSAAGCLRLEDENRDWPCSGNEDCEAPQRCGEKDSRKVCVPPCEFDADCSLVRPQLCSDGACFDAECSGAVPTCGGYHCQLPTGACERACAADEDCTAGFYCSGAACVPKCRSNGDCASKEYCADFGGCVSACAGFECGSDHGVPCGYCPGLDSCCGTPARCTSALFCP